LIQGNTKNGQRELAELLCRERLSGAAWTSTRGLAVNSR
jgi:hypothetical protein